MTNRKEAELARSGSAAPGGDREMESTVDLRNAGIESEAAPARRAQFVMEEDLRTLIQALPTKRDI